MSSNTPRESKVLAREPVEMCRGIVISNSDRRVYKWRKAREPHERLQSQLQHFSGVNQTSPPYQPKLQKKPSFRTMSTARRSGPTYVKPGNNRLRNADVTSEQGEQPLDTLENWTGVISIVTSTTITTSEPVGDALLDSTTTVITGNATVTDQQSNASGSSAHSPRTKAK
jgi:hypothetical protein